MTSLAGVNSPMASIKSPTNSRCFKTPSGAGKKDKVRSAAAKNRRTQRLVSQRSNTAATWPRTQLAAHLTITWYVGPRFN